MYVNKQSLLFYEYSHANTYTFDNVYAYVKCISLIRLAGPSINQFIFYMHAMHCNVDL